MGVFLPRKALPGLKKYKYSSEDHSLISKYILSPFYRKFVLLFPEWLAPNLITLLGLAFTGVSLLTVIWGNRNFDSEYPRWVYFSFAFELFMYQTFDACDGLQARRTGASSPLGELFDHCVDAINTTLGVITFCSVANYNPWMILAAELTTTLNFYLSTWEEYHTGTLYLSVFSGPVEGIAMILGMDILTGFVGPHFWNTSVFKGWTPNHLGQPALVIGLLFNVYGASMNVFKVKKSEFGKAIHGTAPFWVLWVGVFLWVNAAPYLITEYTIPTLLTVGVIFALLVGHIITAHVTHQSFPMWNPLIFVPYVGFIAHFVAPYFDILPVSSDIALLWASLGLAIGVYACFVSDVIHEITTYLGINVLTIKTKPKTKTA